MVGFERTVTGVGEEQGMVQVCLRIFSPNVDCPVAFPFELIMRTRDESAGTLQHIPEM